MQGLVEQYKTKYEDEINLRTEREKKSVMIKKNVDENCLIATDLEAELESLTGEINFLKDMFEAEIHELQVQIKNTAALNKQKEQLEAAIAEAEERGG
ncbi:hypothetical protein scyTo_0025954 [Scyliorhinus torazame]|uniref:IF rod domain-containing protein n=1 Tax=Scyliorhinus torazame TaxID=75743 RepID=A0A401QIZ0_SCYTO|nr:hypothetical protein [Scyliorhinus torazame]